jgi:hypothetical protein
MQRMEDTTMATITQETCFDLLKNELVTLSAARGHALDCLGGEAWITLDGDSRDVIVGPGQTYDIESDAPVVVSALKPSTLKLRRRQCFGPRAAGARSLLVSLLNWEFPPLAAFPSPLIR